VDDWLRDTPEKCGEINMFEIFARISALHQQTLDMASIRGDPNLTDEFYQDLLEIDATKFHVYAHEWTPPMLISM
jgi:hypothetical protein